MGPQSDEEIEPRDAGGEQIDKLAKQPGERAGSRFVRDQYEQALAIQIHLFQPSLEKCISLVFA